jgi:hypothetical protein
MDEEGEYNDIPQVLSALVFLALLLGLWFYLDTLRIG